MELRRRARSCNTWMNFSIIFFIVLNPLLLFVTSFIITVMSMVKVKKFFTDAWYSPGRIRVWMALWIYVLSCMGLFSYGFVEAFEVACQSLQNYGAIDYAEAYETFRTTVLNIGGVSQLAVVALAAVLLYMLRTWFVIKKELSKYM